MALAPARDIGEQANDRTLDAMEPEAASERTGPVVGTSRDRSISDYKVKLVTIDITKTKLMDDALRRVNEEWAVSTYKELFVGGGYGKTDGRVCIAVVGNCPPSTFDEALEREKEEPGMSFDCHVPEDSIVVVDGQHRRHVLLLEEVIASQCPLVEVKLYYRRDKSPMSLVDCLWLGYELNESASLVRAMSPVDHVYSGLSFVKTLARSIDGGEEEGENETTVKLVKTCQTGDFAARFQAVQELLASMKVLPHSRSSMRQYASIIAGLLPYPDVYDTLLSICAGLPTSEQTGRRVPSILKYKSPAIWEGIDSDHALKFRLQGLYAWYMGNPGKAASGKMADNLVGPFIEGADDLYSYFSGKMREWGKEVIDVFAMEMNGDQWRNVEECVTWQCRTWRMGRLDTWLQDQKNCYHFVVRNTPGLKEIADKESRPRRSASRSRAAALSARAGSPVPTPTRARKSRKRTRKETEVADIERMIHKTFGPSESATPTPSPARKRARKGTEGLSSDVDADAEPDIEPSGSVSEGISTASHVPGKSPAPVSKRSAVSPKPGKDSESVDGSSGNSSEDDGSASDSQRSDDGSNSDASNSNEEESELSDDGDAGARNADADALEEAPGESEVWDAAESFSPFKFSGGPAGKFECELSSLPDAENDGRQASPGEFIEMKIAEVSDSSTVPEFRSDGERQVPDLYTDGFRLKDSSGTSIAYERPGVRCGYFARTCLLHVPTRRLWMQEIPEHRRGADWNLLFHDMMPRVFPYSSENVDLLHKSPHNWARRSAGSGYPSLQTREHWEKLTSAMPIVDEVDGRKRSVLDLFMWLRCLGLRPPHRAFFVLSPDDLERVHEDTYLHAHLNLNKLQYLNPLEGRAVGRAEGWFRSKRATLDEAGFCVLEGFARSSTLTGENEEDCTRFRLSSSIKKPELSVEELLQHFVRSVPTAQYFRRGASRTSRWTSIVNRADGSDNMEDGNARYSTTPFGMVGSLESNKETRKLVKARAELDVRILQAGKMMRLRYDNFDHPAFDRTAGEEERRKNVEHPPPLYAPDSGGRFLGTGPRCVPQKAHCDYSWYETADEIGRSGLRHPGYFTIVTSGKATPLWVSRGSHRIICRTAEDKAKLAKLLPMEKIMIPPYSIFFGRGDLTHAGAGFDDAERNAEEPHDVLLRYHMYLVREDVPLTDAISFFAMFSPEPDMSQRGTGGEAAGR